jgi:nucleotide-binding universal stress UspA family protein
MLPIKKLIVPTDFSPTSLVALRAACELAKTFESELIVLHVYPPFAAIYPEGYLAITDTANAELVSYLEKSLILQQEEAARLLGRPARRELISGKDFEEIVLFSQAEQADLIVIGSHGKGALSRFFLGSVTEKVLRRSRCNILVIRDDEAKKEDHT